MERSGERVKHECGAFLCQSFAHGGVHVVSKGLKRQIECQEKSWSTQIAQKQRVILIVLPIALHELNAVVLFCTGRKVMLVVVKQARLLSHMSSSQDSEFDLMSLDQAQWTHQEHLEHGMWNAENWEASSSPRG